MEKKCVTVQENISWAKSLGADESAHLETCPECQRVALEFSSLDLSIDANFLSVEIPTDFTDRVMSQVWALDDQKNKGFIVKFSERLEFLLTLKPIQISAASLAGAFAVVNLIRFVFAVIIPAAV